MNPSLPLARKESLIIKELMDETLVYDLETDKAHCLNLTAACVWRNCDGQKTVAQLRELIRNEVESEVPEELVWLALDQLEQFRLLQKPVTKPTRWSGLSRRQMIRIVGVAAITVPLITSIVAPAAAQGGLGRLLPEQSAMSTRNELQRTTPELWRVS